MRRNVVFVLQFGLFVAVLGLGFKCCILSAETSQEGLPLQLLGLVLVATAVCLGRQISRKLF